MSLTTPFRERVRYKDAIVKLKDGDLLLYRPTGPIASVIQTMGRGLYSHAEMYSYYNGFPETVGFKEFQGGRAVSLEHAIKKYPGQIDVFRPLPRLTLIKPWMGSAFQISIKTNPGAAVAWLRTQTGRDYGWGNVKLAAFRHLPVLRFLTPPMTDDRSIAKYPPYCSQAISMAWRLTHRWEIMNWDPMELNLLHMKDTPRDVTKLLELDPVPHLPDWLVEPSDLARSLLFTYFMTLEN